MAEAKYSKSIKRLEEIIQRIENEEIDVDELSDKVKEAVSLIKFCKEKIGNAEVEVKKVVADLGKEVEEGQEE
jgi:exodeoxyribonuclease VII small subunit